MSASRIGWLITLAGFTAVLLPACSSPAKPTSGVDTSQPPKISCPAAPGPITSPTGQPVSVAYGTPTAIGGAPPVGITCTPPSATLFSIGTTPVTCTATDARQRSDVCTFDVVVVPPPRLQLTTFAAFGDSITAGENGIDSIVSSGQGQVQSFVLLPAAQTYPGVLEQSLLARYTTQNPRVDNRGLPGEFASDPATRLRFSSVVINAGYQVVLLMEGSNDLGRHDLLVADAAIAGLRAMLGDAKSHGIRPYLATIPPMIPNTQRGGTTAPLVPGYNDQVRALAASENVTLVDVYAALNTAPAQYIGPDGLHPNPDGYAKIAETFFTAIKNTLEATPASSSAGWPSGALTSGWPDSAPRRRP